MHHRAGRLAQAAAIYERVRPLLPRHPEPVHLLGVVALQQGRTEEAIALLGRAAALDPKAPVIAMRLGLALVAAGRPADGEPHLRRAVKLQPDFVEAWDNLAYCLKVQDRIADALTCHGHVTRLNPRHAAGWYNHGLTLSLAGRPHEALARHDRALAADPGYANGHYGRAQALQQAHRIPEALAAYDEFLRREPRHLEARSYRLTALNYVAGLTREQMFAEHVAYGAAVGASPAPRWTHGRDPERRLRVAVLSPDLREHSCAYFFEPLARHLPPEEFELLLYHDHFREDEVSARLRARATVWRNVVGQPGPAVEAAIRGDRADLIIDLTGHLGMTSRLPLFARHLAPVQVSYLGYPNTTGLPAMGYRFTDALADPPGEADAFATERLVRFAPTAWAYQPPPLAPAVQPPPAAEAAAAPVTFGCFNNLAKVTDPMLALWGRLLAAVPGSRLLLKGRGLGEEGERARYRARCAAQGLPPERVEFIEHTPGAAEHLALYHRVDVALDTFPYHGTTTTCEALWMGRPVVTLRGDRHAARVGVSLLTAIGRPEWIADTPDDYVRVAAAVAADRAGLAATARGLRAELQRSPLLDHEGQARRFGAALRACWREWCAGAPE